MTEALSRPPGEREVLNSIGREAERAGVNAFLVGGAVRDRLRRRRVRDLDIAIEGNAVSFAREWARVSGGKFAKSSEFGTAAVELDSGAALARVEFASTRAETYLSPAALPRVQSAKIREDLARRDFTINAMAIPLNGPAKGQFLDPHGGRSDLARGIVRMLHARSPQDDPTRAFRAVRFAMRLRFRIEPTTRRWIAAAIGSGAFDRLSGDRLRREIALIFAEEKPSDAVRAMASLHLEKAISPFLRSGAVVARRLVRLDELARRVRHPRPWAAVLSWSLEVPEEARSAAAHRLGLAGSSAREFEGMRGRVQEARRIGAARRRSALAAFCRNWSADALLAAASALDPPEASRLLRAWSLASTVRLSIGGEDLKRSGVEPGPAIGRALEETWRARIDRRIGAAEELSYALAEVRK